MCETFKISVGDETKEYPLGSTYKDVAMDFQKDYDDTIVLANANGNYRELNKALDRDARVTFRTFADEAGRNVYRRSLVFLFMRAVYDLTKGTDRFQTKVLYTLGNGYYCELTGFKGLDQDFVDRLKEHMLELVEKDITLVKKSLNVDDAILLFRSRKMYDKAELFKYRNSSRINVYFLEDYIDYFYGYMVPSTGYLKYFDLQLFEDGIMLMYPSAGPNHEMTEFKPPMQLFYTLRNNTRLLEEMEIQNAGDLNKVVCRDSAKRLVLVSEAIQEKQIAEIASRIATEGKKKFVMIAGPSSSGKTTFSNRLTIQLAANGLKPHPIALDNYYRNRDDCPKDEDGKFNFECLEAIDVEKFNEDMTDLLNGEMVELPFYNFKLGKREYRGDFLRLGPDDILVIEGIHGLNDALSYSLPRESKFKVYISAITQVNIDDHNRISANYNRLIRRIIRDSRTRGLSAMDTIAMWDSVRRGEEQYIFPFQEEADAMFNSALIYELSVLRPYIEPQLYAIPRGVPEYKEAKMLLKFLNYFVPITSEYITNNSILREFIGGSCFDV